MFDDRARLHVVAGRGGDGSIHFRREKHVPKGGPDGGDGGDGGDVVLVADPERRDLSEFRRRRHLEARRGEPGGGSRRHGSRGVDLVVRVPVGTQVLDVDGRLIADLAHAGARVPVACGGAGGRGNARFASATRQVPRFAETGLPGDEHDLELRLKLLADAALVGLPNAGKSSLIARLSNARPKVADYPFTTLSPVLGTVDAPDGTRQLTLIDVPGLIEGASEGVGLGHEFLAHLERARLLLHVIDVSEGDADERWHTIEAELRAYGSGLDARPQAIVLNKIDLLREPPFGIHDERIVRVFRVSAATGEGIDDLKRALFELCPPGEAVPPEPEEQPLVDYLVYRPQPSRRPYRIYRTDRGFRVTGRPPDQDELERALRAAGVRAGTEVEIGDEVLEWE